MRRSLEPIAAALTAALMLFGTPRAAAAWGPEAHRVVALIADRVLQQSDPAARAKLLALLATDKGNHLTKTDIASEATWADALRDKSEEARMATAGWHVVRFNPANPDLTAACHGRKSLPEGYPASHGPQDNCSVDKIEQFQRELTTPDTTPGERLAAVQYLLNLVGDLHDPLLAIDRGDQGGACTAIQVGGKPPVRLATYWATLVTEIAGGGAAQSMARVGTIAPAEIKAWSEGNPGAWARETFETGKTVAYNFGTATAAGKYDFPPQKGEPETCRSGDLYKVDPDYETKAAAAVKQQLQKAGVHLAAVLDSGFK